MQLTVVHVPVPGGFVAFVEELQGASTKGAQLEEVRENRTVAAQFGLEAIRELATRPLAGQENVSREPFELSGS